IAAERVPRLAVRLARGREVPRVLQRGERAREIRAGPAVDLARRESLAIEQHLERHVVAARQRRRLRRFLDRCLPARRLRAALRRGGCGEDRDGGGASGKPDDTRAHTARSADRVPRELATLKGPSYSGAGVTYV